MLRYLPLLGLVACAAPPDGAMSRMGKMSSNGLVLHADLLRDLSGSPLATSPAAAQLASTPDGLELLSYVVTCALPDGAAIDVAGNHLPGSLGLAPDWDRAALDQSGERWVSACLLAHANATGTHVPIWLRADHPAIGDAPGGDFTYQEAAFYGDVFAATPELYACVGRGVVDASPIGVTLVSDADEYLHHRLCSLGDDRCGMTSTGFCEGYQAAPGTCDDDAGADGAFGHCHTGDFARDGVNGTPALDEVITVYLQP